MFFAVHKQATEYISSRSPARSWLVYFCLNRSHEIAMLLSICFMISVKIVDIKFQLSTKFQKHFFSITVFFSSAQIWRGCILKGHFSASDIYSFPFCMRLDKRIFCHHPSPSAELKNRAPLRLRYLASASNNWILSFHLPIRLYQHLHLYLNNGKIKSRGPRLPSDFQFAITFLSVRFEVCGGPLTPTRTPSTSLPT